MLPIIGLAVLAIATVALSGCQDGTVVANGILRVEGEPPAPGRLSLNPIGGGTRAFAVVTEDGKFALRTAETARGAYPGEYLAVFQNSLDEKTKQRAAKLTGPGFDASGLTVIYESPKDTPIVIPEEGSEELSIDIRDKHGWNFSLTE